MCCRAARALAAAVVLALAPCAATARSSATAGISSTVTRDGESVTCSDAASGSRRARVRGSSNDMRSIRDVLESTPELAETAGLFNTLGLFDLAEFAPFSDPAAALTYLAPSNELIVLTRLAFPTLDDTDPANVAAVAAVRQTAPEPCSANCPCTAHCS